MTPQTFLELSIWQSLVTKSTLTAITVMLMGTPYKRSNGFHQGFARAPLKRRLIGRKKMIITRFAKCARKGVTCSAAILAL